MSETFDKRLYNIWACMKQRCNNPNNPSARWYHDKGIRVCAQWNDSYKEFRNWAFSHGYQSDLTIDRIDPNSDYKPENCRWITLRENIKRTFEYPHKKPGRRAKAVATQMPAFPKPKWKSKREKAEFEIRVVEVFAEGMKAASPSHELSNSDYQVIQAFADGMKAQRKLEAEEKQKAG